jgi:hypothetical protein
MPRNIEFIKNPCVVVCSIKGHFNLNIIFEKHVFLNIVKAVLNDCSLPRLCLVIEIYIIPVCQSQCAEINIIIGLMQFN